MIGPDGQYEPVDYIEASAGAAEGNYVTFFVPDMTKVPTAVEFVKAFEAKYGTLSSYGPLAYEGANILLTAIQKAGKADRAAVRDAVRATKDYTRHPGLPDHASTRRAMSPAPPSSSTRSRVTGSSS